MPDREMPERGRPDLPLKENGKRWNAATKYEPSYCDKLIALMKEGATAYEVARSLGITYETLRVWAKRFPEFGEAYELGKDWARGYLEKTAREHLVTIKEKDMPEVKFDFRVYKHMMAVRFGVVETESINHSLNGGGMSEEELSVIIKESIDKNGGI